MIRRGIRKDPEAEAARAARRSVDAQGFRVAYCALAGTVGWPGNPKGHDLDALQASIERFGFVKPVVLDEGTGRVVAGNGRLAALRRMEEAGQAPPEGIKLVGTQWHLPVIRGIRWRNAHDAGAFVLAANRLEEAGGWDDAALATMLQEHMTQGSLAGLGWTPEDVDRLLAGMDKEYTKGKTPAELKKGFDEAQVKAITLYFTIGQHRDVTGRIARLMEREHLNGPDEALLWLLDWHEARRAKA